MEDDLYPNQGEYYSPGESDDVAQERRQERAEVESVSPQLQKVIDHLDTRIAARDSISAINVDISENPELHQKTCAVNQMVAAALREEKNLLEGLLQDIE